MSATFQWDPDDGATAWVEALIKGLNNKSIQIVEYSANIDLDHHRVDFYNGDSIMIPGRKETNLQLRFIGDLIFEKEPPPAQAKLVERRPRVLDLED